MNRRSFLRGVLLAPLAPIATVLPVQSASANAKRAPRCCGFFTMDEVRAGISLPGSRSFELKDIARFYSAPPAEVDTSRFSPQPS